MDMDGGGERVLMTYKTTRVATTPRYSSCSMQDLPFYSSNISRQKDVALRVRNFHNCIKSKLYAAAATAAPPGGLLDLGSGQGGDVHKWKASGFDYVTVVDVDASGLRRLADRAAPLRFARLQVLTQPMWIRRDAECFDAVSSMFSLQCCFGDSAHLTATLRGVAGCLKAGGLFIGVALDRADVLRALGVSETCRLYVEGRLFFSITLSGTRSAAESPVFGTEVLTYLPSISCRPFREHLVCFDTLHASAMQLGLQLLHPAECRRRGLPGPTGSLRDFYTGGLTTDERRFSFMYRYWVFTRR